MNRCVMCNEVIPEGRQACYSCENLTEKQADKAEEAEQKPKDYTKTKFLDQEEK